MTSYSIGRARESALELPEMTASRRHAELVDNGDGSFTVRDLGSSYGTFVNRNGEWEQIDEVTATDNIALRFGGMETSLGHLLSVTGLSFGAAAQPAAPAKPAPPAPPAQSAAPAAAAEPAKPAAARPAPPAPPSPPKPRKEKAPKQAAAPQPAAPRQAKPKAAAAPGTIFGLPKLWVFLGGGGLIALILIIVAVLLLTGGGPLGTTTGRTVDKAGIVAACRKDGLRTQAQCECTANVIVAETDPADRARITEIVQSSRDKSKVRDIMAKMSPEERRQFLIKMIRISAQIASKCRAT